jgi:hypothetical protein
MVNLDRNSCGIGSAPPPLVKGRVGVRIKQPKRDSHPARVRSPTTPFQGEVTRIRGNDPNQSQFIML